MIMHEILEPVDTEDEMLAVGIDFGTTNSLIAIKYPNGEITIIPDESGNKLIPSVVEYFESSILIGSQVQNYDKAISSVKRLIGKDFDDISKNETLINIARIDSNSKSIALENNGVLISPIEVSAEIIKRLKKQAEHYLNKKITKAVITVPAYFDDASRNAIKIAAQLAGLDILRLVNEPTAAAIAYGFDKRDQGTFLIYDLGGGTFDISILEKRQGILEVIAVAGDNRIGGDDFDKALFDVIKQKYSLDLIFNQQNKKAVKNIRELLSIQEVWQGSLFGDNIVITRREFEDAVMPIITNTIKLTKKALRSAKISEDQLSEVIMVGGVTRTPAIRKIISELFHKSALTDINPDEIVVVGAAIQAYALTHTNESSLLLDVTPLTLGLELMGGIVEPIIPKNTPIPILVTKSFTNYDPEQTGIKLHILQGENQEASQCRSLARMELNNMKKMPAGEARIEVTFVVDADGILTVSAKDLNTNIMQDFTLHPSYGLTEEEIIKLLKIPE